MTLDRKVKQYKIGRAAGRTLVRQCTDLDTTLRKALDVNDEGRSRLRRHKQAARLLQGFCHTGLNGLKSRRRSGFLHCTRKFYVNASVSTTRIVLADNFIDRHD